MKSSKAKQNGKKELRKVRKTQTKAEVQNQHKISKSTLPLMFSMQAVTPRVTETLIKAISN
jgi:hypothetical protein